jgi:hypothetical protein
MTSKEHSYFIYYYRLVVMLLDLVTAALGSYNTHFLEDRASS